MMPDDDGYSGYPLSRLASALYRLSQRYYDRELEHLGVSGGQQSFLMHISANEGISILDLADSDHFDKGTTARAIHKLEHLRYVIRQKDEHDRRISRLFLTEEGKEATRKILTVRQNWNQILTQHISCDDAKKMAKIMELLIENACGYFDRQ